MLDVVITIRSACLSGGLVQIGSPLRLASDQRYDASYLWVSERDV